MSFNCFSIVQLFGVAIMAKREAFIIEKAVKLMKLQLKVQNLSLSSHSPKPSTGLDWSFCWANPGFRALCLTPLLYNIIWCTWICVWTADGGWIRYKPSFVWWIARIKKEAGILMCRDFRFQPRHQTVVSKLVSLTYLWTKETVE